MNSVKTVEYVAGFAVDYHNQTVALVRKARPAWQAGKLNGVGGHIEDGEEPLAAMRREFLEEAWGDAQDWRLFVVLGGKGWKVHFFIAYVDETEMAELHGVGDEPIEVHPLEALPGLPVIPNLRWLIPLGLDADRIEGELHETAGWVAPNE